MALSKSQRREENNRRQRLTTARRLHFVQALNDNQDLLYEFARQQYLDFQNALSLIKTIQLTPEIASILAQHQHSNLRGEVSKFASICPPQVPPKLVKVIQRTGKLGRPAMGAVKLVCEGHESGPVEVPFDRPLAGPLQVEKKPTTASELPQNPLVSRHTFTPINSTVKQISSSPSSTASEKSQNPLGNENLAHPVDSAANRFSTPPPVISSGQPRNHQQVARPVKSTVSHCSSPVLDAAAAKPSRNSWLAILLNPQLLPVTEPSQCPQQRFDPVIPTTGKFTSPIPTAAAEQSRRLDEEIHSTINSVPNSQQGIPPILSLLPVPRSTASNTTQPSYLGAPWSSPGSPSSLSNLSPPSVLPRIQPKEYHRQHSQDRYKLTPPQKNESSFPHTEENLSIRNMIQNGADGFGPVNPDKIFPLAFECDNHDHDMGQVSLSSEEFEGGNEGQAYDGTAQMGIDGAAPEINGQSPKGSGNFSGSNKRKRVDNDLLDMNMDHIWLGWDSSDEMQSHNSNSLGNKRVSTPSSRLSPPISPGLFL